jgi:tetratricopeptide (TPR) repeat protein
VASLLISTAAVAFLQAAEAKRATQAAQSETRKAQAVTTFLKDLFNTNTLHQADPAAARRRTAEQLLDDGAKRIKDSLKDAPEQQIELLHTMIELYSTSPKFENILALAQQSMQIAKATYGASDPRTLSEVANFAEQEIAYGRIDVGEAALTEVLPEVPRLVASLEENVRRAGANVLRVQLFFEESYRVKKSLLTARQAEKVYATLPPHEFSYGHHHALGIAYLANYSFDEAEQHFRESNRLLALSGDLNGGPYAARYGQLLALTGRYAEAETKFQTGLGAERHGDALKAKHLNEKVLTIYSSFLSDTSRGAKALSLADTGTPDSVALPLDAAKSCEQFMLAKGQALIRVGLIESGLKCLDTWDAEMVEAKLTTMATSLPRLRGMLELGRLEDAHFLLNKMGNLLESREALASKDSRQYWHHRIAWLLAGNKTTEARAAFEQAQHTLAPPGVGVIEKLMAACLDASIEQKEGQHTSARQRLEAGIDLIAKSPDRSLLLEWQARLEELRGVSLAALGKPAEAQRSLEAALQINKAIFDPKTSISVGRVALRLAGLHKATGRTAIAKAYQVQADAIRRTHPLFKQWVL